MTVDQKLAGGPAGAEQASTAGQGESEVIVGPPHRSKPYFSPDGLHSAALPAFYYHDQEVFEREKEEIWFKTWQFVGLTEDLTEPGSYITADIVGQQIFVIRGKDGQLRGFYNVCPHRGHILLEGKGRNALVVCPFHAWSFGTDGHLNKAPQSQNAREFNPEDYSLVEFKVETMAFMVFVNLDPDALPLEHYSKGLLEEFYEWVPQFDEQRLALETDLEVKANWKYILDGLESYHTPVIHPQVLGGKNAYVTKDIVIETHDYWSSHITRGNYDMLDNHADKLPYKMDKPAVRDVLIWFMWPNLVFVARQGPSNFQIMAARPQTVNHTVRTAYNLCVNHPATEYDLGHMETYINVVWPQDREAMEQQQKGSNSRGFKQGRLLVDPDHSWWSEHATHHFEDLVWRALNGNDYSPERNERLI